MKTFLYTSLFLSTLTTICRGQVHITPTGTLKIAATGILYTSGALENNGVLDTDGDVYYLSDLVNNGSMLTSGGRISFNSSTLTRQNISGSSSTVLFNNLTINLSSPGAEGVMVNNNIGVMINQEVSLQNGNLRLAGESQLLQLHSGAAMVSGSGTILIDQQGTGNVFDFNYWTLPVHQASGTFTLSTNLFDGTNSSTNPFQKQPINFISGLDGLPSNPISLSRRWLFKFINHAANDPNGFQQINLTDNLLPGEGFTMKGSGAGSLQNYVISGLPNDGNYTHAISADNFSILGNPYPSALDANAFISDNLSALVPGTGLFFWDHFGGGTHVQRGYQGGYAVYTLAGGTPAIAHPLVDQTIPVGVRTPGRYIPVGQSFFIQANSSGGNFTFSNSQRVFFRESDLGPAPEGISVFFKANKLSKQNINLSSPNASKSNGVASTGKIRIGHWDPQKFHRQLLLDFNPNNTPGIDPGYDAVMLDPFKNDIFWWASGEKLVIQSLPFQVNGQIPLGVVSERDSFHQFQLEEKTGLDSEVFIFDALLSNYYKISEKPVSVWIEKGEHTGRFFVTFRQQNTLSLKDRTPARSGLVIFYQPDTSEIQIKNAELNMENVEIYNLSGQSITSLNSLHTTNASIRFEPYATGIYLIKIRYENGGVETRKVLKY